MSDISRRDFLKMFGIGAMGSVMAGSAATPAEAAGGDLPSFDMGPLKTSKAKETASVCAFCGCGCGLIVSSVDDRIINIEGDPDNPNNEGSMCCKGIALGDANTVVDYNTHKRRLNERRVTDVLYRAPGDSAWQVKDWDWAIDRIAENVKKLRDETFETKDDNGVTVNRTQAIAHLGSASVDNEENYLMHKMLRSLGVINLDHHARL